MAEFCLECWNRINETNDDEKKYIISEDTWLCEGCAEWKPVIIMERRLYYMRKFRYFILPFKAIGIVLYIVCRLLILPYLLFRFYKLNKNKKL